MTNLKIIYQKNFLNPFHNGETIYKQKVMLLSQTIFEKVVSQKKKIHLGINTQKSLTDSFVKLFWPLASG